MRIDSGSRDASQRLAFQTMAIDMLGNVLRSADNPGDLSAYLTVQLRELTGARTVVLLQCLHGSGGAGHRVVSVNPERRRGLVESAEVARLTDLADDLTDTTVWSAGSGAGEAEEILSAMGCDLSIAVPLRVGAVGMGVLLLLDLPDAHYIDQVVEVLDMLSTVVALVFRNALLYEEQEATIEQRTRELRESEERFRSVAQSANDAIIAIDERGKIALWNDAAERMFGFAADEIVGQPLVTIMPERLREAHQKGLQRVVSTGESHIIGTTVEVAGLRRDGHEFPMELSLAAWKTRDGHSFFTGVARDLSERKQAEEKIRQRSEELATLNAVASAMSESLDLGVILNAALREIVAFTGVDGAECHLPDDAGELALARTWELDEAFVVASRDFRFPVGEGVPGRAFARRAPVYVPDAPADERYWRRDLARAAGYRSLLCVPIIGRETLLGTFMLYSREQREFAPEMQALLMTVGEQLAVALERARLYEELQHHAAGLERRVAERTAELEAFTYSVSHDLRAPLRAIDGFAQVLEEEYAAVLDAEGQRYLARVRAGSQMMGQLIDDLLALTRVGRRELDRKPLDLAAMARQAFDALAAERAGREIDFRVFSCPPARGDAHLMSLALTNLLSNAIKFTRVRSRAIIELGCQAEGSQRVYFVRDNGVGFEMAYADKLFAPFQRLHRAEDYEGTGIGLAIVQRVIQRHGGRVWAEADLGQGATFYFTI